jgi:hypothetical protein
MITRLRLWIARRIAPFPLVQIGDDYERLVVDISDDLQGDLREPEIADLYSAVNITPKHDAEFWAALRRYNEYYDNDHYLTLAGDDWRLGVALQDAALSICGSPYHAGACGRLYRLIGQHAADTWLIKFL